MENFRRFFLECSYGKVSHITPRHILLSYLKKPKYYLITIRITKLVVFLPYSNTCYF